MAGLRSDAEAFLIHGVSLKIHGVSLKISALGKVSWQGAGDGAEAIWNSLGAHCKDVIALCAVRANHTHTAVCHQLFANVVGMGLDPCRVHLNAPALSTG